jgi:Flp pilus assembly protein TadG
MHDSTPITKPTPRSRPSRQKRRGVASVEFAIVLPVLLILVFGTIEICQRIFLRQSMVIAAYEGARLAARRNSENSDVVARCSTLLQERRVAGAVVTVTPANLATLTTGTEVRVTITTPWSSNTPSRLVLRDQGTLTVQAVMLRE